MFKIKLYRYANGRQPIKNYLSDLASKADKDSRIKLSKIDYCFRALREYGTKAGEQYVKHIDDEIWELRPLRDRFFFFSWQNDTFVLLHHFIKKTQKTPPSEIEQAKRNLKDFIKRSAENEK